MKLLEINKVREGKYLKNYELVYENRAGHEKRYEIVSHHEIREISELGDRVWRSMRERCFSCGSSAWGWIGLSIISAPG